MARSPENLGCRVNPLDAEKDRLVSKGHLHQEGRKLSQQSAVGSIGRQ
jgi:hypothetical protein